MPIPFLVAGIVAGVIGAGGHLSAKANNEKAQSISRDAQQMYNSQKHSLEVAQGRTEKALLNLGYEKKNILDTSMNQFLGAYDKIKHIQMKESTGLNELLKFSIDSQGAIQIRQMTDIYSSSIKSGATGAAAGVIVSLAASGSLPIVTGGLTSAGAVLLSGQVGAAAGIAGSALSFGAAMTPLAAVAAPVVLFTGISASMKADENLEKARAMYSEAESACEKMKISETLCGAITDRSNMYTQLLTNLNKMFSECSGLLDGVVRKKEGKIFKKKLKSEDFSEDDIKLIAVTRALAGAIKSVIDTPILSKGGNISSESESVYNQTYDKLSDFSSAVNEIKNIDYKVKAIEAKPVKSSNRDSSKNTVMKYVRQVFAVVIGIIFASVFAQKFALKITNSAEKFFVFDILVLNTVAVWLFLCNSIVMLIGKFRGSKIEKLCGLGSGLSLAILFMQYCRTVEMSQYIIVIPIVFFIIMIILSVVFNITKDKLQFGKFFSLEALCSAFWSIGFGAYTFFTKVIGLQNNFVLLVTSILILLVSWFWMVIKKNNN